MNEIRHMGQYEFHYASWEKKKLPHARWNQEEDLPKIFLND